MKNTKYQYSSILCFSFLLLVSASTYGQFNTRFALELSAGIAQPLAFDKQIDPDGIPYMYQNFELGHNLNAGIYYRLNRRMSIGLTVSQSLHWDWKSPIALEERHSAFKKEFAYAGFESFFQVIETGTKFRYEIAPDSRISPFLIGGVSAYTYSGETPPKIDIIDHDPVAEFAERDFEGGNEYISEIKTVLRTNAVLIKSTTQVGFNGGAGIDFALSNYFSIILQANYHHLYTHRDKKLRLETQFLTTNLGLRMNVFKKRSIL